MFQIFSITIYVKEITAFLAHLFLKLFNLCKWQQVELLGKDVDDKLTKLCYTAYPLPFHLNTNDMRLIQANTGRSVKMCNPHVFSLSQNHKRLTNTSKIIKFNLWSTPILSARPQPTCHTQLLCSLLHLFILFITVSRGFSRRRKIKQKIFKAIH